MVDAFIVIAVSTLHESVVNCYVELVKNLNELLRHY